MESPFSPTVRLTAWSLVILVLTAAVGSYLAKTEIVARGQGRVVPITRVQAVQPQVAGKIIKIVAHEGQTEAGDILVEMDKTDVRSELERIQSGIERQHQEMVIARSIIEPLMSSDPGTEWFVEAGMAAFERERSVLSARSADQNALVTAIFGALHDEVVQVDAQLERISRAREAQQARLERAKADQDIVAKRFAATETLRARGTISEFDYLERLRELKASQGEARVAMGELAELTAEAKAMAKQRASLVSAALATYRKQLNEAEIALQGLNADLVAAQNRLENLTLRAPRGGKVEKLSVFTSGGFVEEGASLMSIVPLGEDIEIEAFFDNRDIGFLGNDQKAFVKFDAFPAERFGIIQGRVTSVGADARGDVAAGKWVYAVRLRLTQSGVKNADRTIKFAPGMTATVDVVTGERRLISYFFEPILKAIQDSFGER